MVLPPELRPFTANRGDFLYKTAVEAEWIRLPSPIDDWKHNCCIKFDRGVMLTQKHLGRGSMCHVKLILEPPTIKTEEDQLTIEATCVVVGDPICSAYDLRKGKAKATAIEHAKTLPLALLEKTIVAVKLRNLSGKSIDRQGAGTPDNKKLGERIWALIDRGYRAAGVAAPTDASGASQAKKLYTVLPGPANGSSASGGPCEKPADTRPLKERLQAHRLAMEEGEVRLRQGLEDDRQAFLRAVTTAFNAEWDQKVAAAVAKHRARSAATMDKVVAEGGD